MSCRMRGSLAEVIFPKPGVPTVAPGPLKLTLLNTLKNSARNCSFTRSVRLVFLITPRFVLKERGPRRIFTPHCLRTGQFAECGIAHREDGVSGIGSVNVGLPCQRRREGNQQIL